MHRSRGKQALLDSLFFLLILGAALLLSMGLARINNDNNPFAMAVFILAVALVARVTSGYFWGIAASLVGTFCVNYFFSYPFWSFDITYPGYPLTMLVMLLVSVLISTLTTQIKRQEQLRFEADREKMHANLLRAIAHDIRTPLASILGASSALQEQKLSAEDQETQQTQKQTQQTQKQTQQSVTPKPPAGSSANVSFYQNLIHVAGDSIAYGFCAYGYIPLEHNIAQGSLAMRNYTSYGWFNVNGRQMRCMDAVVTLKPKLLYVSMGMNDINITNAQTYANNYVGFLKQVRAKVPNCIIVAANITPTEARRTDFSVTKIRNCNLLMQNAVKAMNDPNIILFDAYSVVSAGGTYMASGYGAGDGIHLAGHVYQKLLNSLAIVLDQYSVRQRLS